MLKRAIWALGVAVCLAAPVAVHAQGEYLDVYTVKVKPEKLADFQALTKKWVDANRRFNGDHWLTTETLYGEGDVYAFVSPRQIPRGSHDRRACAPRPCPRLRSVHERSQRGG